jgi:hypothetical protein
MLTVITGQRRNLSQPSKKENGKLMLVTLDSAAFETMMQMMKRLNSTTVFKPATATAQLATITIENETDRAADASVGCGSKRSQNDPSVLMMMTLVIL